MIELKDIVFGLMFVIGYPAMLVFSVTLIRILFIISNKIMELFKGDEEE